MTFLHPRFESERLLMRPQTMDDAEALHEAYADADLMTWWSSAPHATIADTRAYLADRDMPSAWRGWVMVTRDSGEVVGTLATHDTKPDVAEIGYLLIRRFWGRGYAREGVARLIELLWAEGHRRVMADVDPDNAAFHPLAPGARLHAGRSPPGRMAHPYRRAQLADLEHAARRMGGRVMILREWRAEIRRELRGEYVDYVRRTGLAGYRAAPGNISAAIAVRDLDERRSEIVTLSIWRSRDAIRAFAGEDIERARYYPEDDRYLLTRPDTVAHYDLTGHSVLTGDEA